jgi:DNA-binding transcriptional regulator YdaS (Cro superfamily)
MYGVALMRLAHLVGLRQVDITQYLGITSVQVNHWAKGIRPIPEATVPTLVKRIAEAVERSLHAVDTDVPTRAELTDVLREVFIENCHRYGHAPAPSLESFLEEVRRYTALTRPQQLEGPKLEHIEKLTAARLCWFTLQDALRPLLLLLPDDDQPAPTSTEAQQQEQAIH